MMQFEYIKDPALRVLGRGAYGEVLLIKHKESK